MSKQPVIKWTGSKRHLADDIIHYIPKQIEVFYDPFVGGASITRAVLNSNIQVEHVVCSDLNNDLITLWNLVKTQPYQLADNYTKMWYELNKDDNSDRRKQYYYGIRDRFNKTRNASDFLFLNRTCFNGLIRYNADNEFNTSFHFGRRGIVPKTFTVLINNWAELLNKHNVTFVCQSYDKISANKGDFIYLDPPYACSDTVYHGAINYDDLWQWLRKQKSGYALSFDGKRDIIDYTQDVPDDIYDEHVYLTGGLSPFNKLKTQTNVNVQDSLYIKRR